MWRSCLSDSSSPRKYESTIVPIRKGREPRRVDSGRQSIIRPRSGRISGLLTRRVYRPRRPVSCVSHPHACSTLRSFHTCLLFFCFYFPPLFFPISNGRRQWPGPLALRTPSGLDSQRDPRLTLARSSTRSFLIFHIFFSASFFLLVRPFSFFFCFNLHHVFVDVVVVRLSRHRRGRRDSLLLCSPRQRSEDICKYRFWKAPNNGPSFCYR